MEEKNKPTWESVAAKLFCIIIWVLLVFAGLKYLSGILLPFIVAFGIASLVQPIAAKTAKALKCTRRPWAFIYVFIFLALLFLSSYLAVNKIIEQARDLLLALEKNSEEIISASGGVAEWISALLTKIPFVRSIKEIDGIKEMLSSMLENAFVKAGSLLTTVVGKLIMKTPTMLLSVLITVIASFYISVDYAKILSGAKKAIPEKYLPAITKIKSKGKAIFKSYLRAYAILFIITFGEVFLGLTILKQRFAFLFAIVIAIVDILPLFGTGIVLVPWGIGAILLKNYYLGFGLLVLYAAITIVRQVAEPHIIGESLGLHPLLSLFSVFAGLKLWGILGAILAPIGAVLIKEFLFDKKASTPIANCKKLQEKEK